MTTRVAIIGAGITGLVCARELERRGATATVFERDGRVGGAIASVRRDGFLAERGPHTFIESNDVVRRLVSDLGLQDQHVYANEASNTRFVVRDGRPQALPTSPPALFRTDVFSTRAKLALLREPFIPRRDDGIDESVTLFAKRRLGDELLHYGLELLVNGVWAGDPNKLSAQHALPKMTALERDYGSLLRGGIARTRQGKGPRTRMFAFREGNATLVSALSNALSDVRLNSNVARIERRNEQWVIADESFDEVVLTVGASAYRDLEIVDDGVAIDFDFMKRIAYPCVSIITLGFRRSDVEHPLDGFGMLAPACEGLDFLGALFTSSLFDGRAPDGHVTLACFVGGARRPDLGALAPSDRLERVLRDLRKTLGVRRDPVFVEETVWAEAIPQYEVGYGRILAEMEAREHRHHLHVAGNIRGKVAVPDLIQSGADLAESLTRVA